MRKTLLTALCSAAFLVSGVAFAQNNAQNNSNDKKTAAQNSEEKTQNTKTVTNNKTIKTSTDTVYGKVESYEAGKSLSVTVPGAVSNTKSFDLSGKDLTANVASGVKVGDWVRVRETTDNNGHKTVSVIRSSEKQASRAKKTS